MEMATHLVLVGGGAMVTSIQTLLERYVPLFERIVVRGAMTKEEGEKAKASTTATATEETVDYDDDDGGDDARTGMAVRYLYQANVYQGQQAVIEGVISLLKADSQAVLAVLDKFLQVRGITPLAVANYVFAAPTQSGDGILKPFVWELLFATLRYATFMISPEPIKSTGKVYVDPDTFPRNLTHPDDQSLAQEAEEKAKNAVAVEVDTSSSTEWELVMKATLEGFVAQMHERLAALSDDERPETNIYLKVLLGNFKKFAREYRGVTLLKLMLNLKGGVDRHQFVADALETATAGI